MTTPQHIQARDYAVQKCVEMYTDKNMRMDAEMIAEIAIENYSRHFRKLKREAKQQNHAYPLTPTPTSASIALESEVL